MNDREQLETERIIEQGEADCRQFRIDEQVRLIIAQTHAIYFKDENGQVSFLEANSVVTRACDMAELAELERARRIRIGSEAVRLALTERGYIEPDAEGGPVEVVADA